MNPEFVHLENDDCPKCGAPLKIGDYPFCPHGPFRQSVRPDDVPGGFTVENGFKTPQKFYSKKAHQAALDAQGLQICDWNRGDHDKVCPRWDSVDLEGAAQLVSRRQKVRDAQVSKETERLARCLAEAFQR